MYSVAELIQSVQLEEVDFVEATCRHLCSNYSRQKLWFIFESLHNVAIIYCNDDEAAQRHVEKEVYRNALHRAEGIIPVEFVRDQALHQWIRTSAAQFFLTPCEARMVVFSQCSSTCYAAISTSIRLIIAQLHVFLDP